MTNAVMSGNVFPWLRNICSNCGTALVSIKAVTMAAMDRTERGCTKAFLIFLFSSIAFSWWRAMLCKMMSRVPETSPALISCWVSGLKTFGWLLQASASVLPAKMSCPKPSAIFPMAFFPGPEPSASTSRDCNMGMPACRSVANWRMNMAVFLGLTRFI